MIFSKHFTFTKRSLGALIALLGAVGFLGILAIDLLDVGREGGIGPAQRVALIACAAMFLIGLSLIPLGKTEA